MKLKPIITWAIVLFIAFYLVTQPAAAGHAVSAILNGLKSVGNSIATFLNSI
jgi:hypothetical protein